MGLASLMLSLAACENSDREFADFEGGTSVYFADQYPVRTLILGYDEGGLNGMDNQHKCQILSTMGGSYNGGNIKVNFTVDETLCDNLYFEDGVTPVKPMPKEYYSLSTNTLDYAGTFFGRVDVQFSDAFFADPQALTATYVIPLRMTDQVGAHHILSGTPFVEGATPARTDGAEWKVKPMDYVLYCVKYINPYHAYWLRRGKDLVTANGTTTTNIRHKEYVEKDEVYETTTKTLNSVTCPVEVKLSDGTIHKCELLLTFGDDKKCTISSNTQGVTATGSGEYKDKAEIKAWGNKDRDGLYLDYTVDFGGAQVATKDTLVWQRRGGLPGSFIPVYKK